MTQSPKQRTVLFDHDGGVDDFLSLMMLLAMPHIELAGIVVTPADCFIRPALTVTAKILRFFGRPDVEVSQGTLHGVNPFPRTWRTHAYAIDALPILNEPEAILDSPVSEPGHEFLIRRIRTSEAPVTILITGPVTNLAAALLAEPDLVSKVEEVVWMGGALQVPGNVRDYEHDGSAEWNAYWDPPSTYSLWNVSDQLPITLFSLDATNHVPVTTDFLQRLARHRKHPLSDLAGQCWALTAGTIPAYEYVYHMWDTLTTGYLGAAECVTFRQARTKIVSTGPSAGRTEEAAEGGRLIQVADTVDVERFHDYVLDLFRR